MEPELLRFTTAGSVDDGKSTLIGRLLHDTRSVYEDQLDSALRASQNGLDLAFLTDGLHAEREQGITIDVAYRYFSTGRRRFIIADTPGHEQYTRNMATGASTAQLAIVLIDARKGILPQTRRHAYIAWLLGIRRIVIAVNKMDLVNYQEQVFTQICAEAATFKEKLLGSEFHFVPLSATQGDNVVFRSSRMNWYAAGSLLEFLECVPVDEILPSSEFRFPVQYVIRSGEFRGYAGQVASGMVRVGDEVLLLPSGHTSRIRAISTHDDDQEQACAPLSAALCLENDVDLGRGDMIASISAPPLVKSYVRAALVWMSEKPLSLHRPLLLKHTTQRVCAHVSRLVSKVDIHTLDETSAAELVLNEIGIVELQMHRPIFCDPYTHNRTTGSFILIDPMSNETLAAGMVIGFPEPEAQLASPATPMAGLTVWFTGLSSSGKTTLSQAVYERLWAMGYKVELLDGDAVRRHLCKDLGFTKEDRDENIRRIGFVADLLTRNGVIVLVSAISPYRAVRDEIRQRIGRFVEVYVNAPLAVCEQRDVKGLYQKARSGQLSSFTGVDNPYQPPLQPEVECHTDKETIAESAQKVAQFLLREFLSKT